MQRIQDAVRPGGNAVAVSSGATPAASRHVNALDGFRGCAVLLVVMFHYLPHAGLGWLALVCSFGWTGVDAFLVLSAYLITSILYRQRGTREYFQRFYARRALRLFPLYYFILLLMVALTPVLHIQWRLGHLPFFLYATNIVLPWDQSLGSLGPFNFRHLWTLALEEQFYLLWPWVVGSRLSRAALVRICWVGIALTICLRLLLVHYDTNGWIVYESLPTRLDSLLAGALLALSPRPSLRTAWIGVFAALAAYASVVFYAGTSWFISKPMMSIGYSVLALFYLSILALALQSGTIVGRMLSASWLRFYGRYSYGLYLWHYMFSGQMDKFSQWLARTVPLHAAASLLSFATALVVATLISMISFHYIESPFLRMKRRYES